MIKDEIAPGIVSYKNVLDDNIISTLINDNNHNEINGYSKNKNFKKKILIIGNSHGNDLYKSLVSSDFFIKNYQIDYLEFGDVCYQGYMNDYDYIAKLEIFLSKKSTYSTPLNTISSEYLDLTNSENCFIN